MTDSNAHDWLLLLYSLLRQDASEAMGAMASLIFKIPKTVSSCVM
jgi:hypothetical protein